MSEETKARTLDDWIAMGCGVSMTLQLAEPHGARVRFDGPQASVQIDRDLWERVGRPEQVDVGMSPPYDDDDD